MRRTFGPEPSLSNQRSIGSGKAYLVTEVRRTLDYPLFLSGYFQTTITRLVKGSILPEWKQCLKTILCALLFNSQFIRLIQKVKIHQQGSILCYHKISAPLFQKQIQYLKKYCQIVTLAELVQQLEAGKLPQNMVCITFDDGYREIYSELLPVIQQFKLPIMVFLVTDLLEKDSAAWWEVLKAAILNSRQPIIEINQKVISIKNRNRKIRTYKKLLVYLKNLTEVNRKETVHRLVLKFQPQLKLAEKRIFLSFDQVGVLLANGVTVGAHTVSHPILSRIPLEQAEAEIANSKKNLEAKFGVPVEFFSYPNGNRDDFNAGIVKCVNANQFKAAVTLVPGRCQPGDDLFQLKRIEIDEHDSVAVLAAKISGLWGWWKWRRQ